MLEEFFDYKNQLMQDLLTNDAIISLVEKGTPTERANELAYTRVFPYEYIPTAVDQAGTYICFEVDIQKIINKTFLSPTLYVWVFTHKSRMRMDGGGILVDKLVSEVERTINGSRKYGLGELDLNSVKRFAPSADYYGKVMTFCATDFNRPAPNKKPIPSNRKTG